MALPRTGTLGQKIEQNGYVYQWTGVGWNIIGQTLLVVANTNILANNNLSMGNSSANTLITSSIITTGNNQSNSVIRIDTISVANTLSATIITPSGIFSGNSTVNTIITANTFSLGNTTLSSNGLTVYTSPNVGASINSSAIVLANSTVNTTIGVGRIFVSSNTIITENSISIGNNTSNVFINASAIYISNGINQSTGQPKQAFMNASFFSGTANNANYLNGVTNYVTTNGNFTLSGNLNFTAANTFFTSNVNFFGGDKIYFNSGLNENYFTGTAFNALNADALGNYSVDVFELKQDLANDVALLKSACSSFSDSSADSAKLGGVAAALYVNTSGSYTITGVHTYNANSIFTKNVEVRGARLILNSTAIFANSSNGTYGQVLVSNGAGAFWDDASAVVDVNATYVWTNTNQFSNTIKFGNSTVYANISSNTSGTFFGGTANNATNLGGVASSLYATKTYADSAAATAYTNASALASAAYTNALAVSLSRNGTYTGNNVFSGANLNFSGTRFTINAAASQLVGNTIAYAFINSTSVALINSVANVSVTPSSVAVSNSTTNVSVTQGTISVGNTTANLIINSSAVAIGSATINSTAYTGQSNSTVYFGGATSASYVNTTGNFTLGGNVTFAANAVISKLVANGTAGLGGQVLISKGPTDNVFWASIGGAESGIGTVTQVDSGNGLTGGPIVGFGTLEVKANSGIVANSSGLFTNNQYLSTVFAPLAGAAFTGDVSISGNLTLTGNTVIVGANNLIVKDAVMSIHTLADLSPLTSNDGKTIGIAYHYYNGHDKQALLGLNQSNNVLTFYSNSSDASVGDPSGTEIGTIEANVYVIGNSVSRSTVNSTIYTGTANNANNLGGVAAANYVNTSGTYTITGAHTYNAITTFNSNAIFKANVTVNSAIIAGGTTGTVGQVLTSNGTSNVYWSTIVDILGGAVTSITAGDGLNGGTITDTGTISIKTSNGVTTDSNGLRVVPGTSIAVNTSGVHVNAVWLATQTVNSAYYLVGVDGNKFVQNTDSRTLSGNLIFSANTTKFNSNVYFNSYVSTNTLPESNNVQLLGNSTHRWLSLYVSGSGTSGSGIRIGNTFLTDDVSGTTDALVVNTFIANTANVVTLTANSLGVNNFTANSISISNPLAANSGGTGLELYDVGDLLYASATNALTILSIPAGPGVVANGQILQIINNLPAWGHIDCGESSWSPL